MKNILTLLTILGVSLSISAMAQSPDKMSYQAVIRDNNGTLISNQQVGMQISILQGSSNGTPVYVETQSPTTNTNGLASFEIGAGQTTDDFSTIEWSAGPHFVKTEVDPTGNNSNYTITTTNQLMSVPYALYAKNGLEAGNNPGNMLYWDGNEWQKLSAGTHGQSLIYCNNQPMWRPNGLCPGEISGLTCASTSNSGFIFEGLMASDVESNIPYVLGNGDAFSAQTINSIGVSGLTAVIPAGVFANGSGSLNFSIEGTPNSSGIANFPIQIGGQTCTLSREVSPYPYPAGSVHCGGIPTSIVEVVNPVTGKTWMDRNLGASQAATSSSDASAYGDLYQWGRGADGHQCRDSDTTTVLSPSDQPGHGMFYVNSTTSDWRQTSNNNLWQGLQGINNPCPAGFKVPTISEWESEMQTWGSQNENGAFNSPLKLTLAGTRIASGFGLVTLEGNEGRYWSQTYNSTTAAQRILFNNTMAEKSTNVKKNSGMPVRCIKN